MLPVCEGRPDLLVAFAAVLGVAFAACDERRETARAPARLTDLVVVTLDTVRADHLGAYGYARESSPHFDRLAASGALFETVYAPMGATCPSHATLFTGRAPARHGVVRNGFALAEAEQTLAEILRAHGYRTAAFVSSYPLKAKFGLAQGFDTYDDDFTGGRASVPLQQWEGEAVEGIFDRRGESTVDRALAWLAAHRTQQPLFLWVHLFDPHAPYDPPDPAARRLADGLAGERERMRALYDGEIRYTDAQLGRLLAVFDAERRDALVVVASDHGEGLWDHGWQKHNRFLYDEEVRVALALRWPGDVPAGVRVEQPAHLGDLVPTLLGMLGIPAPEGGEGWDLGPFVRGEREPVRDRALWLERPYYREGRPHFGERGRGLGVRVGAWKWIEAAEDGRRELYDLARDPRETRNLAEEEPERAAALSAELARWRERNSAPRDASRPLAPEDEAALRELGYAE